MIKYTVCNVYTQATADYNAEKIFFRRCVTSISDGSISYEREADITIEQLITKLSNYGGDGFVFTTIASSSSYTPEALEYKYRLILPAVPGALIAINPVSSAVYWRLESLDGSWVAITTTASLLIGGSYRIYHDGVSVVSSVTLNTPHSGASSTNSPLPWGTYIRLYTGGFDSDGNLTSIGTSAQIKIDNQVNPLTKITYRAGGTGISIGTDTGAIVYQFFNALLRNEVPPEPVPPGEDPYEEIPESEPGSGDGTFDFDSADPIDFPNTPTLSAVSTGFFSIWLPTNEELEKIAGFMWNINPNISTFFRKLFTDPMDAILGLSIFPMTITAAENPANLCLGLVNTGIGVHYTDSQWVQVDCGTLQINETWGAYLDYSPYTKAELYLPYCGTHPIQIDDFMGKSISIMYYVDLVSGACVALVKNDVSIVYTFMGQCSAQIPVTQLQFADVVRSVVSLAANVGTMIATHGAYAAKEGTKQAVNAAVKAGTTISQGSSVVENVMGMKPAIERSGAIGANAALLAPQKPYIILTRPNQARASRQNELMGYPSFITYPLEDLTGYTEVEYIHLHNIPCTDGELDEIEAILKSGVIF